MWLLSLCISLSLCLHYEESIQTAVFYYNGMGIQVKVWMVWSNLGNWRECKCARLANRMYLHERENMVRNIMRLYPDNLICSLFWQFSTFFPSKYSISDLYDPSKAFFFFNSHMLSSKSLGVTLLLCHFLFSLFMAHSHILLSILTSPSVPVYKRVETYMTKLSSLNENERKCLSLGKGSSATYTLSLDTGCFYARFQSDPCTLTL